MEKLYFDVSAKTARLIGRENIADVDGAIIELVKNAYDADASCVYVRFDMPFPNVPLKMDKALALSHLNSKEFEKLLEAYFEEDGLLVRKENTENLDSELENLLFAKNKIFVIDNGSGMDSKVLKTSWMNIGTDNKEKEYSSKKGRIKTGAKGIGRFALDKLSKSTKVITKASNSAIFQWSINWEDFTSAKLLKDVRAILTEIDDDFETVVKSYIGSDYEQLSKYSWKKGTIIELAPTREPWNLRLFTKVNNNLKSINPLGNVDKFDVYVKNTYFSQVNYIPQDIAIHTEDFDYRIWLQYDGAENITLKLLRNEIDVKKEKFQLTDLEGKIHDISLDEFWARTKFQLPEYTRESYDKEITRNYVVSDFFQDDNDKKIFRALGPITFNAFFIKNSNIDTGLVKDVKVRRRKSLLHLYSGIKIYRDNFKVRPYGDDGPMYDWLNLGKRAQISPAAVSHEKGAWRVEPYQLIGSISIGRLTNPNLTDMANREGIALNDTYYLLVAFLQQAISKFEYDRQYVFREFAIWKKQKLQEFSPKKDRIISRLRNSGKQSNIEQSNEEQDEYSKDDYADVLQDFIRDEDDEIKTSKILMMYSSSGIITNTFAHEIQRLGTDFGSRMQHLNYAIKRIITPETYDGDEDFNPFTMINEYKLADELLSSWIAVVMDGLSSDSLIKQRKDLIGLIGTVCKKWEPLLEKKHIAIVVQPSIGSLLYNLSDVDIYLILNNFILNSAWFLENTSDRMINISLTTDDQYVLINLENNGEPLDPRFRDNPYVIFDAGVTSKEESLTDSDKKKTVRGTGLGLWVIKEIVNSYFGQIEMLDKKDGFGFTIKFPR